MMKVKVATNGTCRNSCESWCRKHMLSILIFIFLCIVAAEFFNFNLSYILRYEQTDRPITTTPTTAPALILDSDFSNSIPSYSNTSTFDFKINEDFFEKLYNNNFGVNILLIGASHGGSDPVQRFLSKKYPLQPLNDNKIFYTVMMEPSHNAFNDLDRWTKTNNALYGTDSLHVLNAAFNNKYNVDENLTFYDWSDEWNKDFPKEPLFIKFQQGSFVKEHIRDTFRKGKENKGHPYHENYIQGYNVASFCLQTIVKRYFMQKNKNYVNMVFVDAQGFEYFIVKSILLDKSFKTNIINFELDMSKEQRLELLDLAKQSGYNCWCPWTDGCCQDCKCIASQELISNFNNNQA